MGSYICLTAPPVYGFGIAIFCFQTELTCPIIFCLGIVIGTLGVSRYLQVLESVKRLIISSGKKPYIFAVGKINVAKIANFAEVDTFCLIACPENSIFDSRDYHAPIVTPFELEIALGMREWGEFYSADFRDLMTISATRAEAARQPHVGNEFGETEEDDDRPYFSLVSGSFRQKSDVNSTTPTCKNGEVIRYSSPAANFLKGREYQGLDLTISHKEDASEKEGYSILEGRKGIASDYGGV